VEVELAVSGEAKVIPECRSIMKEKRGCVRAANGKGIEVSYREVLIRYTRN
jgi:hypothetical protein